MSKNIKISLSRGHKIVERITREIDSLNATICELTRPVTISVPEEVKNLNSLSTKIEEALETREKLYSVLELVRSKIAKKNASTGIQELLAKRSILNKRKESASNLIASFQASTVVHRTGVPVLANDKSLIEDYFKRMEKAEVLNPVKVTVITNDMELKFDKDLKDVQFKLDAVSDDINDVNARSTISFEIDEHVAVLIGL